MAVVTRRYKNVGITPANISRYLLPTTVSIVGQSGAFIDIQYDNTTMDTSTLDDVLGQYAYVFDANAGDIVVESPTAVQAVVRKLDTDPSVTATNAPKGSILIDVNGNVWEKLDNGSSTNVTMIYAQEPVVSPGAGEIIPMPEGRGSANGTLLKNRAAQINFTGTSYFLRRRTIFNRVIVRSTAVVGAGTVRVLIYQAPQGGSGVANLIATCSGVAAVANTNLVMTPTQGLVTAAAGVIYALWGCDGGTSVTFQTNTIQATALLDANVDTGTHPATFTTTIDAATAPATLNPLPSAGVVTGAAVDILQLRLKQV